MILGRESTGVQGAGHVPQQSALRAHPVAEQQRNQDGAPGILSRKTRQHPWSARRMDGMDAMVRKDGAARWDCVSLGEVMLRLDPGEGRVATTREFTVWEGGGEYNVARGLRRCFGLRTAVVTALADNPVGRLCEDM